MKSTTTASRADFKDTNLYLGLDTHKRSWSVSVYLESVFQQTFTQAPDPDQLTRFAEKHYPGCPVTCAYESGRFDFWIQRSLEKAGWTCLVVQPGDIPRTTKQQFEKSDPVDSRKIPSCLQSGLLRGIHIPSVVQEDDRHLVRSRKKIWGDLTRAKNRIKSLLDYSGIKLPEEFDNPYWSTAFTGWLWNLQVKPGLKTALQGFLQYIDFCHSQELQCRSHIRQLLKEDRYAQQAELLMSIPGIGKLSAATILTEVGDIHRFPRFVHFNSWVGLKPMSHSSGEHDRRGHLTLRANNAVRSTLVECSWVLIRKDPALGQYYHHQSLRLGRKRAIIAVARKLASRIYHILKHKEPYETGIA